MDFFIFVSSQILPSRFRALDKGVLLAAAVPLLRSACTVKNTSETAVFRMFRFSFGILFAITLFYFKWEKLHAAG